jgi:hypothetical protein
MSIFRVLFLVLFYSRSSLINRFCSPVPVCGARFPEAHNRNRRVIDSLTLDISNRVFKALNVGDIYRIQYIESNVMTVSTRRGQKITASILKIVSTSDGDRSSPNPTGLVDFTVKTCIVQCGQV